MRSRGQTMEKVETGLKKQVKNTFLPVTTKKKGTKFNRKNNVIFCFIFLRQEGTMPHSVENRTSGTKFCPTYIQDYAVKLHKDLFLSSKLPLQRRVPCISLSHLCTTEGCTDFQSKVIHLCVSGRATRTNQYLCLFIVTYTNAFNKVNAWNWWGINIHCSSCSQLLLPTSTFFNSIKIWINTILIFIQASTFFNTRQAYNQTSLHF